MKKIFVLLAVVAIALAASSFTYIATNNTATEDAVANTKYDIKIKNDTDDAVSTINTAGGGYNLAKGVVTTIKMEEGDELFIKEKGKKGRKLLTVTPEMDGKVQLLSKL
jgi:uncharacterized protein YxeA